MWSLETVSTRVSTETRLTFLCLYWKYTQCCLYV